MGDISRRKKLSASLRGIPRVAAAACSLAAVIAIAAPVAGCGRASQRSATPPRAAGALWEEVRIGTDAVFNGLHFVDAEVGWIVGGSPFVEGGIVGRTEDGGRTWTYKTGVMGGSAPSASLNAVHAFDRQRACVVSDRGIFLTIDGGGSWVSARVRRGSGSHLLGLHFLDENEGWAVGLPGVLHTKDGGTTWETLVERARDGGDVMGREIHFVDARNGWIAGMGGALLRTRDGGATWARVPVPLRESASASRPYLFGMTWRGNSEAWIVGENGTVLHSGDGGDSWSLEDVGDREAFLTAVQFVGDRGWIVGFLRDKARSFVFATADSGAHWTIERRLDGEELRALQMLDEDTGWAVGDRVRTQPQRLLRRVRSPER